MRKTIYESVLDDWMPEKDKSQSNELRKNSQESSYIPGEGESYENFYVRVRIQLANIPATPEYPYHFKEVIENVQQVLDSTRFIEDYSEIFLTTNDDSWVEVSDLITKDDYNKARPIVGTDYWKYMYDGLFLNFSFSYNDNTFKNPYQMAKVLVRLNSVIELAERDFIKRCHYFGIWWKHGAFNENYNIISVHMQGLVDFVRRAGQIDSITDRNFSGYCQLYKLYNIFFDADIEAYDRIFNQCRFDVEKTMIDTVYIAVYATNNLIDNIIDYKDETKIESSGNYNLSNFLKSFGKDNPMNEQFFYYMWPIPDQNIKRGNLQDYKMPVYDSDDVKVHPMQKRERDLINKYLLNNDFNISNVDIKEKRGRFLVIFTLDTICPEDEVPMDICLCFSAPSINSGIIDAIYKPTDPEFRRNINLKWVGWMYDNYLLKFMPVECADIVKKYLVNELRYFGQRI